jgi:PAS domain S-box-containing protein
VKTLGPGGSLLTMNPAGLSMIGVKSVDEVKGKSVYPLVAPEHREAFKQLTEDVFRGKSGTLQFEMTGLHGRRLWLETHAVPLRNERNEITALLAVTRDITDRKRSEQALKESERRYRDLFENANDPIFFLDADRRYVDVNRRAVELFGYSKDEFLAMSIFDVIPPDQRERSEAEFAKLAKSGRYEKFSGKIRTKDGRWLDIEVSSSAIIKDGKVVGSRDIVRDLTDRKRAEERLRESEERLAQAQAMAHVGNWEWDTATNEVFWSDEVYRIYGYEPGEVRPDYDLVLKAMHPDTKGLFLGAIDAALKGERPFEMDYVFVTRNGEKKTLHTIGRVFRDGGGKPVRMVGVVQDITGQKHIEAALRESEERFRMLFENAPDAEFLADIETGTIIDANPAACRLLLMPRDRIVGLHQTQLHPAGLKELSKSAFDDHAEQTLRGDRTSPLEIVLLRSDGEEVPVEVVAQKIVLQGKPLLYGIFRDITKRKQAEAFVKNILETVDEGFIVISDDYTIVSANKAYCAQVGTPAEEIVGRKCHEISHGIHRPCFERGEECAVRRTFETGEPHTVVHVHYDKKKNPIYVETKSFPVKDESGRVTAAIEIVNNVTEKKKLEDQLRHAQKMEAVGLLAGGIAHDFNNILTAIIGYGNLLEMKLPPGDPVRAYVDQILASSARAANLTQSLLAFSRKQIINPLPVDVNEIIARVERLLHRVIGEDVELQTAPAPVSLTIMADPSQIEQVLMNLATNARDAMPEGGVLTIRTDTAVIDEGFRKTHGFGNDGVYACVSVKDTGTGMDEMTRDRIFEPFFTTKALGRGTGLGLAIVYGIMKQNNGYVTVTSEPGKGSVFHLYFPLIEAPAKAEFPAPSIRSAVRGSGTILLAEDDPALRALIGSVLREFGYTVIEAMDGEDAVDRFREHQDRVQLLILDVVMPRKNGREAFSDMRRVRPDVKTLFISGYHDDIVSKKVLVDDGCHFIAKPVSPLALLNKVQQILVP